MKLFKSRKQYISEKTERINRLLDLLGDDDALAMKQELLQVISKTSSDKAKECYCDYILKTITNQPASVANGGKVTNFRQMQGIKPLAIQQITMTADESEKPVVMVLDKKPDNGKPRRIWAFPVDTGFGLNICNDFLKSLNLGIDIKFENFCQYGQLMWDITFLLEESAEAAK